MNADGSNQTRLTSDTAMEVSPKWLPDGRITFTSNRNGQREIYVMNADGSNVVRVTTTGASVAVWSRDGKRIAFVSRSPEKLDGIIWNQLFVMDADGNNLRMITKTPHSKFDPCWSPDGNSISFMVETMGMKANLFQIASDGEHFRRLTAGPTIDVRPACSPNGSQLAFVSNRDGNSEIYVMNLH